MFLEYDPIYVNGVRFSFAWHKNMGNKLLVFDESFFVPSSNIFNQWCIKGIKNLRWWLNKNIHVQKIPSKRMDKKRFMLIKRPNRSAVHHSDTTELSTK